jgi:hypothetical protein
MKLFRKLLLLAGIFLGLAILYLPFRLLAQRFNIVFLGLSDNFYHWFSLLIWPIYAFLWGAVPMFVARRLHLRWLILPFIFIVAFLVCNQITILDDYFNIPAGGLCGFQSYPANYPGMNTPHISVILCPVMFLGGTVAGTIVGWYTSSRSKKEQDAEL